MSTAPGGDPFNSLVADVLDVEPVAVDRFRGGIAPAVFDRLYGGQTIAQALLAAAKTVPATRPVHSMHAYYLRLGSPALPVEYLVRRLRDSRSFSARSVTAEQDGQLIAEVSLSFHDGHRSFSHQLPMPEVPPPEELVPRSDSLAEAMGESVPVNARAPWPTDIRYIDHAPWDLGPLPPINRMWVRVAGRLAEDHVVHSAALAYLSDLTMFEVVIRPHEVRWADLIDGRGGFGASLDHSIWFHRQVRADEWLLHVQESPVAGEGRGLATGRFFTVDGSLVASVAQEVTVTVNEMVAGQ